MLRTLRQYERLFDSISNATGTPLEQIVQGPSASRAPQPNTPISRVPSRANTDTGGLPEAGSVSGASSPELNNPEDYEFDESQDKAESIDGMGFLASGASQAGYIGPQSSIAALKLLRVTSSAEPTGKVTEPSHRSTLSGVAGGPRQTTSTDSFITDYFTYYHPAYPLLHEGLFRARLAGQHPLHCRIPHILNLCRSGCKTTGWLLALAL